MENLALKDEQIARQAEEIESLNRKIESLEKELRKCLDPDSGEINPSLNYKQETQRPLIDYERIEQRLWGVINKSFLPVRVYNSARKQWGYEYQPWWYFREFLFESTLFNEDWTRPHFRLGIDTLNDICQATEATGTKKGLTSKHLDRFDFAGRLFGGSGEWQEKKIIAVNELTDALWLIIENYNQVAKGYVGKDDLYDMMAALKIVSFCQRLSMDAEAEEKDEETEETEEVKTS